MKTEITNEDSLVISMRKNEKGEMVATVELENHMGDHAWIIEGRHLNHFFKSGTVRVVHAIQKPKPKIVIVGANHPAAKQEK